MVVYCKNLNKVCINKKVTGEIKYEYEDDDYENDGKDSIKSTYEIVELEAISSKIVEICETSEA